MTGPDEARWTRELDAAFDDVREAHGVALAGGNVDLAIRLVVGIREYSWRRIRYELLAWADVTVTAPGADDHPLFPVLLGVVAYGRFVRGEAVGTIEAGERAVDVADKLGTSTLGLAERAVANAYFYREQTDDAVVWSDRMLAIAAGARRPEPRGSRPLHAIGGPDLDR